MRIITDFSMIRKVVNNEGKYYPNKGYSQMGFSKKPRNENISYQDIP